MEQTKAKTKETTGGKIPVRQLAETAILIALATVLSMIKVDMPMGGGLTMCSMLPIVVLSCRYGWKWGVVSAVVYSILQLLLGLDNVGYAAAGGIGMALGCLFLDYVVAYTALGLSGWFTRFGKKGDNVQTGMCLGIIVTFVLRFLCHFVTGVWIWEALWPNEYGMDSVLYSLSYNGWYMAAELALTLLVTMIIYKPLEKYITGKDLSERRSAKAEG